MRQEVSLNTVTGTVNVSTPIVKQTIARMAITRRIVAGAYLGLTWGAAMRAWMALLALEFGDRPEFSWQGTFGAILLPALLMGAMLGGAAYFIETLGRKRWRWALLSPLLMVIVPAVITDSFISTLVTTGIGGGAIAVALIGLLGGYALSGFGPGWLRWVSGVTALFLTLASGLVIYLGESGAYGASDASRAFNALLFVLLMALLTAGISAPYRQPS